MFSTDIEFKRGVLEELAYTYDGLVLSFFCFEENSDLLLIVSEIFSHHLIAMHVDVIVRSTKKVKLSFVCDFTNANANFGGEELVGIFLFFPILFSLPFLFLFPSVQVCKIHSEGK